MHFILSFQFTDKFVGNFDDTAAAVAANIAKNNANVAAGADDAWVADALLLVCNPSILLDMN